MSHQGINSNTNGGDMLLPQQSIIETSYFLITQGSAQDLLPQLNALMA